MLARLLRAVFLAARCTALLLLGATACGSQSVTAPRLIGEGRRILFVRNSLTYVNDLPGILQALANGLLLPVASAWVAARQRDMNVQLYAAGL